MIAVISTGFVFEGLVKYHSNKIESENSLIISSNLYANNLEEYQHRIENIAYSYTGKNTKPVKHFILSLPPDEKLDEQKFAAASKEYLEKIGYDQNPYVTILHTDEKHQHVHIITTNVRFDRKKTSDKFERVKSQRALREIEQKYDLKIGVGEEKQEQKKLNEINLEKYQFSNAFKIAIKKGLFTDEDVIKLFKGKQLTDAELKNRLGFKYKILQDRVVKLKLVKWTNKQNLSNILKDAYVNSDTKEEYKKQLESKGVYYREIQNKIKYGFEGVYYGEDKVAERYRLKNINEIQNKNLDRKLYLKTHIDLALNNSKNMNQFVDYLAKLNVDVRLHSNERGIYGISYIFANKEYKASDIDRNLSYTKIDKIFKDKEISNDVEPKLNKENDEENTIESNSKIENLLGNLSYELDDKAEENKRKKKKKKGYERD